MLIHIVNQFRVKLNENIVDSDDKIAKMGGKTYSYLVMISRSQRYAQIYSA